MGIKILLLIIFTLIINISNAQPPPPPPQDIPLDGGILWLLLGGIGLIIKKIHSNNTNSKLK